MNARALPSDFLPLTRARRARIERTIELLLAALDDFDGSPDLEPELGWTGHGRGCREDEPTDDREGGDERDCDLAGAVSDIECDYATENDMPGFIWGGNESGGPAHSGA